MSQSHLYWARLRAPLLGLSVVCAPLCAEVLELPAFEVTGGPDAVFALPGSGIAIGTDVLEAYRLDDLHRLMARVPGVYFRPEDGYGLLANISLRGVDLSRSSKLTLMEDGVPTAPAPYAAPAAYYTPTLGRMAAVEVLKGSSQVRYGPHSTGGVINYQSTPLSFSGRGGQTEFAYGTDADARAHIWLNETVATAHGTFAALAEVYHRQTDGFRHIQASATYPGSDATGFERTDSMLKIGWLSEDGSKRLTAKIGYTDGAADISYLGLNNADFAADPLARYPASRLDVLSTRHFRSLLEFQWRLSPQWSLSLKAYYNSFHRNWYKLNDIRDIDTNGNGIPQSLEGGTAVTMGLSAAVAGAANATGLEVLKGQRAGILRIRHNNRDYYLGGIDAVLTGTHDFGEWSTTTAAGLRLHNDRIRRFQWHDRFTQSSDGAWSAPTTSQLGSDGNRRQFTEAIAAFVEQDWQSGRLSLRPGLRIEHLDLAYTAFSPDPASTIQVAANDTLTAWAAGMAASFALNDATILFANAYRGFSVPSPSATTQNNLGEETSLAAELGLRLQGNDDRWALESVAFFTRYEDLIVIDNVGSGSGVSENAGNVDSHGLEFLARYALSGRPGHPEAPHIPITLSATYTRATLDGNSQSTDPESIFSGGTDGSPLPYLPEWKLHLAIDFHWQRFASGVALSWQEATRSTASGGTLSLNPINNTPDARYNATENPFLLDAYIEYQLTASLTTFLNLSNLLDEHYLVSSHPHGPRSGPPRSLLVGLRYDF